jgi:hypothetical protein
MKIKPKGRAHGNALILSELIAYVPTWNHPYRRYDVYQTTKTLPSFQMREKKRNAWVTNLLFDEYTIQSNFKVMWFVRAE